MQELFEKMVNITFQAQAQGEIGAVTGERIDEVVAEYEEYCNQEERKRLIAEAKSCLNVIHEEVGNDNIEEVVDGLNNAYEYLDEIEKYN